MSDEDDLRAEIERLRAKVEVLQANNKDRIRLQVSVKGALSSVPLRDPPLPGHVLRGRVGDDPRKERRDPPLHRRAPRGAQAQGRMSEPAGSGTRHAVGPRR